MGEFDQLIAEIRACRHCTDLPLGPNPIVRGRTSARVMVISQAPGTRVHETVCRLTTGAATGCAIGSGSGATRSTTRRALRSSAWRSAIPGATRRAATCARPGMRAATLPRLLPHFSAELTLLVGSYAINRYLGRQPMTAAIQRWRDFLPGYFVLPHPSWRTNFWERTNPWFTQRNSAGVARPRRGGLTRPLRSAPCPRR